MAAGSFAVSRRIASRRTRLLIGGRAIFAIVLACCLGGPAVAHGQVTAAPEHIGRPESELIVEGEGSFGHYHIFAYSWWSELYTAGLEYDRHSWGSFIGSRMDYVAEVLPLTLLKEPSKADLYGDPLTKARQIVPGVAISPIGLRMMWRNNKAYKPYFIVKGGVIAFDKKALSPDASYQNFSLQIGIGMQARLTDRLDFRVGYADIHFSNAFMVPSNPGLDVMSYNSGLIYHFK